MREKTLEMTMLLDFYGELLTEKQRGCFELYYNDDLSLGEIAENLGITRQGVRDQLLRAENALRETEAKTGLLARFGKVRRAVTLAERLVAQAEGEERELAEEILTCLREV